jgi:hypothetical protein
MIYEKIDMLWTSYDLRLTLRDIFILTFLGTESKQPNLISILFLLGAIWNRFAITGIFTNQSLKPYLKKQSVEPITPIRDRDCF